MKKLFACLLAMMMVLSLVACSNGGNTDTENTGNDDETNDKALLTFKTLLVL